MTAELDRKYMLRAIELAKRGAGHTRPNPMVGAVLVKDGRIIGEGWHEHFGGPHAEVNAFAHATEDPEGATLYVSLEPCSHYGKTPPCADLIIKKKVARVVTALEDPNPLVSGKGIRRLMANGIRVTVGVCEEEARRVNEVFLKYITRKKPFVLYKAAMSLDGKIACHTGDSQWVSSEESRKESHRMRGYYAGIMVGAGTVLHDDPQLTARTEGLNDPVRIIVDGHLSVPASSRIFHEPGRTIMLITSEADEKKKKELEALGAEMILCDSLVPGKVDLNLAMTGLAVKGIDSIILEGGSETAASALEAGIIDKVRFYIAQKIIGGKTAPSPFGGTGAVRMADAVALTDTRYGTVGSDLVVEAYIAKDKEPAAEKKQEKSAEEEA